jgi:hypothetical protein
MASDPRLVRLDEHQATIQDILRRGQRMLRAPDRDAAGLARARWELARAIMAYQGFKHREIFDPIARAGAPDHAHAARRLKGECVAAGDAFRAYVAKWSAVSILDHWSEYQPAALALIAGIKDHLTRERREAGTLLKG